MILPKLLGEGESFPAPQGSDFQADLAYQLEDGRVAVIDVKFTVPGTRERLQALAVRLRAYSRWVRDNAPRDERFDPATLRVEPVLIVNGLLSRDNRRFVDQSRQLQVIDLSDIRRALGQGERRDSNIDALQRMLSEVRPGKEYASRYQQVVRHILEYLLCPPLQDAIYEHSNATRTNRREIIFPNYSDSSFWSYMRHTYAAHYVVVDAKNYSGKVKKNDVLQMANYLNAHGSGLFGMIVTRNTDDRGALQTRREQWITQGKLIVVLNDADLRQMMAAKVGGDDPAIQIRQIIEDFRLAF